MIPLLPIGGIDPDAVDLQRPRHFKRTRIMHVPLEVGDAEFFVSVGEMLLGDGDISFDIGGALRTVLRRLAGRNAPRTNQRDDNGFHAPAMAMLQAFIHELIPSRGSQSLRHAYRKVTTLNPGDRGVSKP